MTTNELNKISIKDYLSNMNIHPIKDRGYYAMYQSPFREDNNASLKVDFEKNLWIDFGSNEGGTMIDLVMRLNNCSVKEAIEHLSVYTGTQAHKQTDIQTNSFSFHGKGDFKSEPSISIFKVLPITNKALIDYLMERKINIDVARQNCKEVYYSIGDKRYFAIGFRNDSEGYELRNKYFKGCTNKNISIGVNNEFKSDVSLVFEGFMDYLSYLTLNNIEKPKINTVVLNSITNLPKAMDFLKTQQKIYTFLDNDVAGQSASQLINKSFNSVVDQSTHYAKYKDLNDLLCDKKLKLQEEPKRKPSRGFRL